MSKSDTTTKTPLKDKPVLKQKEVKIKEKGYVPENIYIKMSSPKPDYLTEMGLIMKRYMTLNPLVLPAKPLINIEWGEKEIVQYVNCISKITGYLEDIGTKVHIVNNRDMNRNGSLLNIDYLHKGKHITITGDVDLFIMNPGGFKTNIYVTLELKRDVESQQSTYIRQLCLQNFCAQFGNPHQVLSVLTDLVKNWYLAWSDKNEFATIYYVQVDTVQAMNIIKSVIDKNGKLDIYKALVKNGILGKNSDPEVDVNRERSPTKVKVDKDKSDKPAKLKVDKPDKADKSTKLKVDKPEKPVKLKVDKPDKADKPTKLKVDKPEKPIKKVDKADKPAKLKVDKPEKSVKVKVDKADKPVKLKVDKPEKSVKLKVDKPDKPSKMKVDKPEKPVKKSVK